VQKKVLSIIITCYNEKDTIAKILEKVLAVPLALDKDIVVVDGNSQDGTRDILKKYKEKHSNIKLILEEKKEGKGAAIRKGLKLAGGDICLIQDADLELNPNEIPGLLEPILEGKTNVVYGSRFKNGIGATPIGSFIGNQAVTWFINILYLKRLTDIATCYKVFRPHVVKGMKLICNGFDFDAEFTCRIIKRKETIFEVPIAYKPRRKQEGKKLNWTAGLTSLWIIFKVRWSIC